MGKLKKDISSVTYLHFVNNIWKTTRACCNCRVVNGECADIARKGKCNAFRNELNAADILVFKNESYEFVTTRDAISKALEANRNNADCPCHRLEAEEKKWQNTVKELRSEIALLTRKLECEQEWMPYEDVSGQFYENIANNGVSPASDEETVRFVSTHFGFDMTKISIKRVKPLYEINRHQQLRQAGVTVRNPYIFASDWNYIYFSSMGIDYEILNGKIIPL